MLDGGLEVGADRKGVGRNGGGRVLPGLLRGSVGCLHQLCRGLDDAELEAQSYSRDRSIAGVLSLLGLGCGRHAPRPEDVLAGRTTPDGYALSVWDEWNAKLARAKADGLVADEAVFEALAAVERASRTRVTFPMGPCCPGVRPVRRHAAERARGPHLGHVGRLRRRRPSRPSTGRPCGGQHGVHRPLSAQPTGEVRMTGIHTSDPARDFTVRMSADNVQVVASEGTAPIWRWPQRPLADSSTAGSTGNIRRPSPATTRSSTPALGLPRPRSPASGRRRGLHVWNGVGRQAGHPAYLGADPVTEEGGGKEDLGTLGPGVG